MVFLNNILAPFQVMEMTEENLKNNPNRWSFDEAADHIFCLMKNDSYQRFLRSELYRDLVNISKKKVGGTRIFPKFHPSHANHFNSIGLVRSKSTNTEIFSY